MHLLDIGLKKKKKTSGRIWEKILEDLHLILKEIPLENRQKYAEIYQGVLDSQ